MKSRTSPSRPIHLAPERHPSPPWPRYDDGDAVVAFERDVREHRAFTEPFVVTPLDSRVDGAFRVASGGRSEYVVDVVDGSRHSSDTFPSRFMLMLTQA